MFLEKLKIFPDKPLDSDEQDKFNRSRFVKALAQAIRQSPSKKGSTVLALMGPWGCGKTSLKNLAIKALEGPTDPRVMEFCPWQLSGTGKITTLFFEALIQQISGENEVPDADSKRKNFRLYANLLSKGASVLDVILGGLSPLAHTGDATGAGALTAAHAVGGSMKVASNILTDLGKELPTDVVQLKRNISDALSELTRPILVVIDDIDRLPSEEIFEVIQIVNVNADFPNLVYLLLFDRRAVERSIERSFEHRGRDFLEKIIQGSFHVPALSLSEINNEFSEQLDTFVEGTQLKDALDPRRLSVLFFDVLWRYLGNPRHIKRLFSSISFYIGQFSSDEGPLEVDLIDLIGIETLRLFETDIYEALPRYRDFLTASGEPRLGLTPEDIEKTQKEKRKEILELTAEHHRDKAVRLLEFLFPPLAGQYRGQRESLLKLRVCRGENFYRYFTFRPGLTEVSEFELQSLFATADSPQKAGESLRIFLNRGSFAELITRLEHSLEQLPEDKAMGLAKAFIDIGDELPRRLDLMFDDVTRSQWLFQKIVIGIASSAQGLSLAHLVSELLSESSGVIIPAFYCNALSESLGKEDSAITQLIDSEQVRQLSRGVVEKIVKLAHEGKLKNHLHSASLVYFWGRWGHSTEIKAWIDSVIDDQSGLFWFLRLVSQTRDFPDPDLPGNPYQFKIELVEQFVDLANLQSRIQTLESEPLQERERKLEQAISLALKEWDARQERKGLTEDPAQ